MSDKPTLEQVTKVLRQLNIARAGWIGEGDEIVRELLAYVDGKDAGIADWALSLCGECGQHPDHNPPHWDWCSEKNEGQGVLE